MSAPIAIRAGRSRSYTIPTDAPEADGTIAWDSTTMVVVEVEAGGKTGLGYSYAHKSSALVARELVEKHCLGHDAMDIHELFGTMRRSQRNYGSEGIGATALSAVDIALWDLKAKLLATTVGKVTRRLPRFCAGVRIRRIHFLRRQPVAGATRRLGGTRQSAREDEDRNASGAGPLPCRNCAGSHR